MHLTTPAKDPCFIPFEAPAEALLPERFTLFANDEPHPLCLRAAEDLQHYLRQQKDWQHNFGLSEGAEGTVIGKMFGVLVVKTQQQETGYLAAFSGKLAGGNHHAHFVPPVFDGLSSTSFVNKGMLELTRINNEIKALETERQDNSEAKARLLKTARKSHSVALQYKIFEHYHFLNRAGESKSLEAIFKEAAYKNPPVGAGECAAPKLLQYAFQQQMQPLALVEFWWGLSPKSATWKHRQYYACCKEKCEPILKHMLQGIDKGL